MRGITNELDGRFRMSSTLRLAHAGHQQGTELDPETSFADALSARLPLIAECRGRYRRGMALQDIYREVLHVAVEPGTRLARPRDLKRLWLETVWPLFAFDGEDDTGDWPAWLNPEVGAR